MEKTDMNRGVLTALASIGIAQGLKIFTHKKLTGKWDWRQVATTGGMPSSHSAGVSALAAYIAANKGSRHTETALATIFGVIVMYDAQGIRRHTGEIAKLVNELQSEMTSLSNEFPSFQHEARDRQLKELLGHQPLEVLGGSILGGILGYFSAIYENRERKKHR